MTDVKKAWLPASFCINIGTRDKGTGAHRELQNIFRLSPIQWLWDIGEKLYPKTSTFTLDVLNKIGYTVINKSNKGVRYHVYHKKRTQKYKRCKGI